MNVVGCLVAVGLVVISIAEVASAKPKTHACAKIESGTLVNGDGEALGPGFDAWGYNYQAQLFKGGYCDSYRDADWCQPYKDYELRMKWNEAWLSSQDCDGDGVVDEHRGYDSFQGSGATLHNHLSTHYAGANGETCTWNFAQTIEAVPLDATLVGGVWYSAEGDELGTEIWGEFAVVKEQAWDSCN